jgi:UV excision repair protein RAD23
MRIRGSKNAIDSRFSREGRWVACGVTLRDYAALERLFACGSHFSVKEINSGFRLVVFFNHSFSILSRTSKQESQKAELPATTLKLIHSGKILKDEDAIGSCGVKENDFLVVMVTKPKKAAAAPPKVETAAAQADAAAPAAEPTPTNAAAAPAAAATTTPAPTATETPAAPRAPDSFPDEVVTNLTSMGFPEAEVRHCLRAAHGNPDVAVEFLTNGIPDGVAEAASFVNATSGGVSATPAAAAAAGARPLQALRNHPQFDALRRLVQSNPGALQQVLTQIGQQQPDLLAEINANQAAFLEMMNEPVTSSSTSSSTSGAGSSGSSAAAAGSMMEGMGGNPAQMAQMIQSMSEGELEQMAAMMGLSPDQLRATAQMIGQMPAEQLNQFMMQAMGQEGGGGDGPQVLRLTEEEMAAVDRLTEMGFDRSEAAQAFLACDKNEALAANLLMDSMGSGGFFGGDGGPGSGNNDGGGDDNNDDDDDNMYD